MTEAKTTAPREVKKMVDRYKRTHAVADGVQPVAHQPLTTEKVLRSGGGWAHWQGHASVVVDGVSLSVYSRLESSANYSEAGTLLIARAEKGGFSLSVDLTSAAISSLVQGLNEGERKVRQIQALGSPSEVAEIDDWLLYEQTTGDYVKAKMGGMAFRVFANQLDHMSTPEVQLMTYSELGFRAGSQAVPSFLSPDAADELADALKAAAYRARMLKAEQIAQGGTA
ncbi:hypothetical protein DZC30_05095 [Comamonas testosteroni]|uniref:Uncharacterized protein n=1 Tax=Comamonas testosteroni TaxID=285 RepID=A0A373FPV4_COMTE|nr:hypothetical protein [Comamonas testosteroni]RGE46146.1 hypothetical protein DZC30_05095 [Comamonas testosteroni]